VGLAAPPPLAVGDWWNYTITAGGQPSPPFTYVVTADSGTDYTMETDSASLAFFNLRSDVSTLGAIRKADLAGSQGDTRVQFLKFPLVDGGNWTATWDGLPITVKAHQTKPGAFDLTATRADGTPYATYSYDNATRWFSVLDFKDAKGASAFKMSLARSGHGYQGSVARWDLQKVADLNGTFGSGGQQGMFDVPLTATDVWAAMTWDCSTGSAVLGVAPFPIVTSIAGQDPRGYGGGGEPCPSSGAFQGSVGAPKAPAQGGSSEQWDWSVSSAPGSAGSYTCEILVRTFMPGKL